MKREVKCGIYCIRNLIDNKRIIGSSNNIFHRWATHKNKLKYNKHNNPYLRNAWNKHGVNNFILEIIEECLPENLIEREDYYIIKFKTLDRRFGYNLNLASRHTQNEESKEKIRQSRLGKKMSDEQKKKLSEAHMGKINGPHSQEWNDKISKAHKGIPHSSYHKQRWLEAMNKRTEFQKKRTIEKRLSTMNSLPIEKINQMRDKIAKAHLGKKHSEETKIKISEAHKGENNFFFGKRHSEESKRKMSEKLKGRILKEETKLKISIALKGKSKPPRTEEHIRHLKEAQRLRREIEKLWKI